MLVSRRLILVSTALALALVFGVPAALGQSVWEKKNQIDSRISGLRSSIADAKQREGVLSSEIGDASSRIDALAGRIGVLSDRLATLERDLAAHRSRLARLEARFEAQTRRLVLLRRQLVIAERRLGERLVALYEAEDTTTLDVLLQAESLTALIEQFDYFSDIGRHDQAIAEEFARLKLEMKRARADTAKTKREVAEATAVLARKTEEERAARAALLAQQSALAAARSSKQGLLSNVREDRHEAEEDLAAMQAASASLAAKIRASQSSGSSGSGGSTGGGGGGGGGGGVSSSGFIWPVNGVLTSGFGWRWGRMHEGIDISAPCGTPIRAAAAGQIIHAGWMGGYGNLVVIDHGSGLSTAYAHQSAINAGGSVSQGQTIGAVGSTGSSTGCHLHFEVRVNGSPVNPLGYL